MPGMLMSERMRMRLASLARADPRQRLRRADCANSIAKREARNSLAELLAEQIGDVGLVVDDEDQRAHATAPVRGTAIDELGEGAGLRRHIDRRRRAA